MGKWIRFDPAPVKEGRVTQRWFVVAAQGDGLLGEVRWYSGWRRYVFAPNPGTEYEQDCLRDIAAFVEEQTKAHRALATARKESPGG